MNNKRNTPVRHWDALGNPILGLYEMWDYYKADRRSLDVVKRYLPHRIRVVPTITITFRKDEPAYWQVDRVYPGGSTTKFLFVGKRAMQWARDVWCGKNDGWGKCQVGKSFLLKRFGWVEPIKPYANDEAFPSAERS